MNSRMDKYKEVDTNETFKTSRTQKNQTLYNNITNSDYDNINLNSNARVIGDNGSNIDVEKIKEMLEKKYRKAPVRRSLYEEEEQQKPVIEEEETKEYDINAILEKARMDKDIDYEKERLKKIRDTQYDILKGLKIEEEKPVSKVEKSKEDNLMNLINTITEKESQRELNPLDLLTDLKGNDNTVVANPIKNDTKEDIKKVVKEEVKKEIDKSFYTNSLSFTKSDFDDFNDLKEDIETNKVLIRVLLVIVAIALLIGIFFLVNEIFNLGIL